MPELRAVVAVGGGAAIGGILRFLATQAVVGRFGASAAPYATAFINVSGSFLIGVVIELAQARADFSPLVRLFAATGVLGRLHDLLHLFVRSAHARGRRFRLGSVAVRFR